MAAPQTSSRLELLQARFQQRQLMEKEQKLLQLYDQQQQRAHQVAQRGSAGSNTSNGSGSSNTQSITRTTTTTSHSTSNSQGGKVRQMFDERRQTTVKGIDRSYPLEPLENKPRKTVLPSQRNGNAVTSRQSVTVKRTIRADSNGNVNNAKPVINYHEEVTRETFGPKLIHRDEHLAEFTNENDIDKWTNGNDQVDVAANNNEITEQGTTPERPKYGNPKKEAAVKKKSETFHGSRSKQESRVYRNMIKMELGRESPEFQRRSSLRGVSKSPDCSPRINVTESKVHVQTAVNQRKPRLVRTEKIMYTVPHKNTKTSEIHEQLKARERLRTPSPIIRRKSEITLPDRCSSQTETRTVLESHSDPFETQNQNEHVKIHKIVIAEEPQSPTYSLNQLDERRSSKSPIRMRSPSPSDEPDYRQSSNKISLKSLDEPKSLDDNNGIDTSPIWQGSPYPRRKSEFEKSRIFRKIQEDLDHELTDDVGQSEENFKQQKGPKYSDTFIRIKAYPGRVSQFEKSETFTKTRKSSGAEENRRGSRSTSPPRIAKNLYSKASEYPGKKRSFKTTFNKLQEDLDRSSPEGSPVVSSRLPEKFSQKKKPESKTFKKLQRELGISPEPKISPDRPHCSPDKDIPKSNDDDHRHSPTRVDLQDDEIGIPVLTRKQHSFEKLRSVELLKDHLLLAEKKIVSNSKYTLEDVDKDLPSSQPFHAITKKDGARSASPFFLKEDDEMNEKSNFVRKTSTSSPSRSYETVITHESSSNIEEIPTKHDRSDYGRRQIVHKIVKEDFPKKHGQPSKKGYVVRKTSTSSLRASPEREVRHGSPNQLYGTVVIRKTSSKIEEIPRKCDKSDYKRRQIVHKIVKEDGVRSTSPSFTKKDDRPSKKGDFIRKTSTSSTRTSPQKEIRHKSPKQAYESVIICESSSNMDESLAKPERSDYGQRQIVHEIVEEDGARSALPSFPKKDDQPSKKKEFVCRTSISPSRSSPEKEVTQDSPTRSYETVIIHESSPNIEDIPNKHGRSEYARRQIVHKIVKENSTRSASPSFAKKGTGPNRKGDFVRKTPAPSPSPLCETVINRESSSNIEEIPRQDAISTYERTDSVESALRKFNSIEDVATAEPPKPPEKRRNSGERRSSLHAATASWTMRIKATNQHIHKAHPLAEKTPISRDKLEAKKSSKKGRDVSRSRSSSPSCKKRLFTDSDGDSKSPEIGEKAAIVETTFEKTTEQLEQPPKLLRSIEDIRNSMTRDCEFMTSANDNSADNLVAPKVVIRIISPNTARRTGYVTRYVESAKSTKSPEINVKHTRRIEKTSSPDHLSINSTERKNKTPASARSTEVISRPASSECNRERESEPVKVDSNDNRTKQSRENSSVNKKSSAFVIDLEDESHSKANSSLKKTANSKQSPEKILSQSKSKASTTRPPSALSNNSSCSSSNQEGSSAGSRGRMSMKARAVTSGNRTPSATKTNSAAADSGLASCKICDRRFASDRISLHEQICSKTSQKKRKTFDPVVQRVKGTELEPFVKKMSKKGNNNKTAKKTEVKSNWRRKHEDFINAIRSAKQMQAHLAAGGKLSDLPPPPASDTSHYIQCPHCGRKFNQAAAERHIPKCENMLHNKPNPRAPAKAKR